MRIATKLMAGSTAGMLLVLAVHAFVTFRRESDVIEADSRGEGERLAHAMALAMAREWDLDGQVAAESMIVDVDRRYAELQFRWVSAQEAGAALSSEVGLSLSSNRAVSIHDGDLLSSFYQVPAGADRGLVSVTQDLSADRVRVRSSILNLGFAVVAILLLNALLAVFLSRRWVARPLEKLFEMARRVGAGELEKRVTFSRSAVGEFVELGSAMNEMAEQLETGRSEREAAEQRRIETEAQLRHAERLTTVGRLASGVAHEIGTPLNVITGNAAMITRGQVDDAGAKKSATTIATHADRITSIVKQLLGFARRSGPVKANVDVAQLCRDTLILLRPFARKRRVELVGPETEPQLALVDSNQIKQVVTNLVMNGVQAMDEPGELSIAVAIATAKPTRGGRLVSCVRIDVCDHGSGISEDQMAHIFEPFFTTKDVGEGTGLGLSVVHGIVRDHGGWIEVKSVQGQGSTFSVFLPQEKS